MVEFPVSARNSDTARFLRYGAAAAWISWLLSMGLLWIEHQLRVLHPWSVVFLVALTITFSAAVTNLVFGFWRVLRGGRRRAAFLWSLSALLPIFLWVLLGLYAYRNDQSGYHPHNVPMMLMTRVGHNLMEAQAVYLYPHRLESERLVMFYGDSVTEPERDIQAMDRHVAHLEEITGLPLRAKIYWTRGQLLGRGGTCVFGIVIGSSESPVGHLDRHELAHAVEQQHGSAARDSPMLLAEGWAESQSVDAVTLAADALRFREQRGGKDGPTVCYLRLFTDSFWYHRHRGAVYSVGGAFVDFLIRHYGAKRFMDFYFACRPGTLEAECDRIYGTDLESLEKAFWTEAERLAASKLSTKEPTPMEADLGAAQEAKARQATKEEADTPKSAEPGVTLQFRLAEAEPAAHLIEATVVGTARVAEFPVNPLFRGVP